MEVVNAKTLNECLNASLNVLKENEKKINDLNVFPVPDGDTGTNMRLTLESGLKNIKSDNVGAFFKELSLGMLVGARGNSGVILSIIFKGISNSLKGKDEITPLDFLNALKDSILYSYKTVKNPIEGTILTVLRLGVEVDNNFNTFEELLILLTDKMKRVLDDTPKMLKTLEEAKVVDAGGAGLLLIISGMLNNLKGCKTEVLITNTEKAKVRYYKQDEHKPIAYVAFCVGEGMKEIFYDLGCDVILESPLTINPSTKEIVDAINAIDADNIVILPNNKNALLTATLAKDMLKNDSIYILETTSLAQGYFALSMMVRTSDNIKYQLEEMKKGINDVLSIEVAKASKDGSFFDVSYKAKDYLFIVNGNLKLAGSDLFKSLKTLLDSMDLSEKEIMAVFAGSNIKNIDEITDFINDNYELESGVLEAGFKTYDLVIGIS